MTGVNPNCPRLQEIEPNPFKGGYTMNKNARRKWSKSYSVAMNACYLPASAGDMWPPSSQQSVGVTPSCPTVRRPASMNHTRLEITHQPLPFLFLLPLGRPLGLLPGGMPSVPTAGADAEGAVGLAAAAGLLLLAFTSAMLPLTDEVVALSLRSLRYCDFFSSITVCREGNGLCPSS